MGGGVNPLEWVLPPVALTHMATNAALQQVSPRAKIIAPGSATDKEQNAEEDAQKLADQQKADQAKSAADFLAGHPGPQTPEQEEAARRRAQYAGAGNLGGRRASQVLGGDTSVLGV